jgi:hypothetical protein
MKTREQLQESIERYRVGFWEKRSVDRPPVGIVPKAVWLPISYLREPFTKPVVEPDDVTAELVADEYECIFAHKTVTCDDYLPFVSVWRGVPWLEAVCGCPVRYSSGSLAPAHFVESLERLNHVPIPADNRWRDILRLHTQRLADTLPEDCFVAPTILRGPSDVLAAMRGLTEFYCDLMDNPRAVGDAAGAINKLLCDVVAEHFSVIGPKHGGYGHVFGYWSPEPTYVIQEDAMGMARPQQYREVLWDWDAEFAAEFDGRVLFHLHSTGYAHWRDVLEIPNLVGLQMTVEANGPSLLDMADTLEEILERSRLILYVEHFFEQLPDLLKRLPKEGLYLILPDDYIKDNTEYGDLLGRLW